MKTKMHTLRDKNDFTRLFRRGQKFSFPGFMTATFPNRLAHSRFAFIVPNTVDKRAVARNRLRRRIREWARINQARFNPPADIAFLVRKEALGISRKKLYEELDSSISKIFG